MCKKIKNFYDTHKWVFWVIVALVIILFGFLVYNGVTNSTTPEGDETDSTMVLTDTVMPVDTLVNDSIKADTIK